MLVSILLDALAGNEYNEVLEWVWDTYDHLVEVINRVESSERTTDQNAIKNCLNDFKNDLMELCVNLLYRLPASEKVRLEVQWCMTADEMVECGPPSMIVVCRKRKADNAQLDSCWRLLPVN